MAGGDGFFIPRLPAHQTRRAYEGGLLNHSMNVYKLLANFNKNIKCDREDSLVIAGLLHDVCKTNMYVKGIKNVKTPGKREWTEKEVYMIEDELPIGHGENLSTC